MKNVTLSILILASVLLAACGQGGSSPGTSSKGLFSLWTNVADATDKLEYQGLYIGYTGPFINDNQPQCTYEIRVDAIPDEPNGFTRKTVDTTNPADPTCFDYSTADLSCTLQGNNQLECCVIGSNPIFCDYYN